MTASATFSRKIATCDGAAWEEFFNTYAPKIFRFAYQRLNGRVDDAETVVSETFLAAARTAQRLHRDDSSLEGWIYTIARSKVMDFLRQKRKQHNLISGAFRNNAVANAAELIDTAIIPEHVIERAEFQRTIGRVLASLPAIYQKALVGRYIDRATIREIAERIGCRAGVVDGLVFRARKAFARRLRIEAGHEESFAFAASA